MGAAPPTARTQGWGHGGRARPHPCCSSPCLSIPWHRHGHKMAWQSHPATTTLPAPPEPCPPPHSLSDMVGGKG